MPRSHIPLEQRLTNLSSQCLEVMLCDLTVSYACAVESCKVIRVLMIKVHNI